MNVLPTYTDDMPFVTSTTLIKIGYFDGDVCCARVENRRLKLIS